MTISEPDRHERPLPTPALRMLSAVLVIILAAAAPVCTEEIDPKLIDEVTAKIGPPPRPQIGGGFKCVKDYVKENFDDPSRTTYIKWSGIALVENSYWGVRVKLRGPNRLGALYVQRYVFLIRNGVVVEVIDMYSTAH
jgi:hypothetical protein